MLVELIRQSIEKWQDIAYNGGVDMFNRNCPLCAEFAAADCRKCPVMKRTGVKGCFSTPWRKWYSYAFKKKVFDKDLKRFGGLVVFDVISYRLAKEEIRFLESLLPSR